LNRESAINQPIEKDTSKSNPPVSGQISTARKQASRTIYSRKNFALLKSSRKRG
jgi:hypothetical protein